MNLFFRIWKKLLPFFPIVAVGAGWLGMAFPVHAQTALLSGTTPAAFSLVQGSYGNGSIVTVTGQSFTQAWQVNVTGTAPSPQNVTLTASTAASVVMGDVIVATFSYRRTDTTSDEININARFEQIASPVADSIVLPLRGRGQWRQISVPFIANASYGAGAARFYFQLSAQIQSLQISGVTLIDYGQKSLFGTGIIDATPQFVFSGSAAGTTFGTNSSVAVSGNPFFTTAQHISVIADPHDDSLVKVSANVPSAVTSGDTLVAIFWVRDADTIPKNAVVGVTARQAVFPNTVVFNQSSLIIDGAWKQHIIPFNTGSTSYAANGMQFFVKCSAQLQTVEFGGLQLLDLGTSVSASSLTSTVNDYPGRLIADSWRTDANARIATYRKGNFTINVTDGGGNGIGNAGVSAAMQKHLFGFGSAVQAKELTPNTGSDADTYRANVKALFNKVVFENEMKWVQWESTSVDDPKLVTNAITWLRTNGIFNVRGHNLVWPNLAAYCPGDVASLSGTALTGRVLTHIDSESQLFKVKTYISDWDVVNEPYTNHTLMDKINGIASGRGTVAQDAAVIQSWFSQAATDDTFPNCFLNDADVVENPTHLNTAREDYNYSLLSNLLANGTPVDGFGFESHFTTATPPLTAKAIFDRFAALGIKEQVTEFDQNVSDQILQADFLSDYLTMVFSEPNFDSFLMWGFWDTMNWLNNAPLFTSNWTLKPSGEAWKGLVFGQWWTDTGTMANSSGVATVNGFLGRYALTGSNAGITKTYYADLPRPSGAAFNLKLSGTTGATHVWLHSADRAVLYSPFTVASDPNACDGFCVTSGTGSGSQSSPTTGLMRIDTEATGTVNIWLRVIAPATSSNAFWISVDAGTWQIFSVPVGTSWHWVLWGKATLSSGNTHPINLADADGGTQLDQVLITDDLSFTPVLNPLPVLTVPANITVNAMSKNGAIVSYGVTANDSIDGTLTPVVTPASGSTFPIGATTVNGSATNSSGGTSTASFTVTVLRTFAWFEDQYGLLDTDPAADPNHTGVSNLLAYSAGVNPSALDRSQLPSMALQNGFLQISYPRWKDAADLAYVVEVSADLKKWDSGSGYTGQASVTPIDATREQVIERDLIPTSNGSNRFIRLRITH